MPCDRYADSKVPLDQMTVDDILDCAIARLNSYILSGEKRNPANVRAIIAIQKVQVAYDQETRQGESQ